ncbi:MAG: DUF6768 family protein [Paracoccaceae bacterium]
MGYLDIRISELMSEQEEHLLRSSQQLGWLGLARSLFHGRLGWTVWINLALQLVLVLVAIWAAVKFFQASDVLLALKYGLSSAVLVVIVAQFKLSLMPHIQAERILRALKRVEIILLAHTNRK